MDKIGPNLKRTMSLTTWSFWLGLYSVLTHKPKPAKIIKYGKYSNS